MRGTIHLVSRGDFWPFARRRSASARREWWLRVRRPQVGARRPRRGARRVERAARRTDRAAATRSSSTSRVRPRMRRRNARSASASSSSARRRRAPGTQRRAHIVRARRGLARPARGRRGRGARAPRAPLPRRVRAGDARTTSPTGPASPVTVVEPRSSGMKLRRFRDEDGRELVDLPARAAARSRDARAGSLPADVGRDAARPRAPHRHPARARTGRASSHEDAALVRDVPRRRRRRGHVALRAAAASSPSRSSGCRATRSASSTRRPSASPRSTPRF